MSRQPSDMMDTHDSITTTSTFDSTLDSFSERTSEGYASESDTAESEHNSGMPEFSQTLVSLADQFLGCQRQYKDKPDINYFGQTAEDMNLGDSWEVAPMPPPQRLPSSV